MKLKIWPVLLLIGFLLSNYAFAEENSGDIFDKYRQQTLEESKETPPASLPSRIEPKSSPQPPPNALVPTRPKATDPNELSPPPPNDAQPNISPQAPSKKSNKEQQTTQPANIWLKPNPWGNTTNNPWAPHQQPTTLPKNEKAPTKTPKQSNGSDVSAPHNIFAPGR